MHRLWEPLAAKQNPPNGYAAKFSIPYAIAVGMLRGDAGLVDYEEAVVHDPAVRALAGKVRYVVDPDNPYPRQFTGHVRVTLEDRRSARGEPGAFSRRARRTDVARGARGEVHRQLQLRRLGRGSRAQRALAVLRALRAAPRVDLTALRG